MSDHASKCGYVAIVGRPNVGKSTLMNKLIGQKISITSRKPQTTRHQVLGVSTTGPLQMIYVDTPGMLQDTRDALQRTMQRAAQSVLNDVDAIVWVVEAGQWRPLEDWMVTLLPKRDVPVILCINKIDQLKDKTQLLPYISTLEQKFPFHTVVPISAKHGTQISALTDALTELMPQGAHLFPEDQITDRSERFLVSEIIREKLMRFTGAEIPYGLTVTLDTFETKENIIDINATVWVNRQSHKRIVIGEKGAMMKRIGQAARMDIQTLVGQKVMLRLWVKVKQNWVQQSDQLSQLGYD